MPALVESCVPKRQNSVPTQVFTMRTPLVYAWPDGMPRSAQTFGQVRLLDAEQIDALAAGDLHHRHVVLVGDVGDAAQLVGRRHAAANARNHRERAVLLDVGVDAIVDEARRAIFVVVAAPEHVEHVAQRRLADLAAQAVAVDVEHLLHRLQPLAAQDLAQLVLRRTARSRRAPSCVSSSNSGATAAAGPGRAPCSCRSRCWRACTPSAATAC